MLKSSTRFTWKNYSKNLWNSFRGSRPSFLKTTALNHSSSPLPALTSTAVWKFNGVASLLQHMPASIFGSIISIADIASNSPNMLSWINSPSLSSLTQPKNSVVISFHSRWITSGGGSDSSPQIETSTGDGSP